MKKNLNYLLDDDLFWNSEHGEELSLALKKNMDFNDAELFPKLESGITKIEEKFGQIVRDFYSKEKSIEEEKIKSTMQNKPLNQILYGPPGTGKTFNTINKAISIANPEFNLNEHREILKKEYDRLVEAEQIVFTTFHQSMSYEDFIEGIKPVMTEDEGEVNYEIQDGIFKEICKTASQVNEITVVDNFEDSWGKLIEVVKENIADDKLVKIGSWEYGLSTKESLKYSSLNSPSQYTFTITKQNILDTYQNKQARPSGAFQKDMEDVVNYMKANLQLSDYRENNDKKQNASKERNYVLIIDEINRGNVSQIFGELITLIEESKRLGNSEELQVTLPYSKKKFGVPSNLYIIGTMNTADRSVEALDTALRRRFSFVEMMPDSSIVEEGDFTDHQRVAIMKKINQRIELLLDRNYTLGHSYFIKNDFKTSFKNEIIPLLQEYFYNDCGKIGLILGRGFVREKEISKVNHQTIFADFDTRNEIEVIKSYELIPFEEIDFENALDLLLA
ncbi:McrB family protein [Epilithonimonas lactis]|uniref:McrB family protein n=1 Tax=Epilithonimonas lactis TaxID=421072 RepID=UPI000691C7BE|nr:AAA family ATPase [Epilithonimonas lactis]SEQ78467.1 5-methylcytosine-specific restriction enzyme B [Epilithonimonas lactis]